jgi:cardiolipin synthase (CMP-forming)
VTRGLPNLITIGRILLVPLTVWLIVSGAYLLAFAVFVIAGISDGLDGFIAKQYGLRTELGAYLDPLADKVLLVSIYVALALQLMLPAWLTILVVSRDVMIVGAVLLARLVDKPMAMKPSIVSKVNTAAQIALAGVVLGVLGFGLGLQGPLAAGYAAVGALTVASGALYLRDWVQHMANGTRP